MQSALRAAYAVYKVEYSSMKIATLCYVRHDQQTLMLHRGKKPGDIHAGKWNGLGGKLEAGEDPETGVIREVFEESGLQIYQPQLAGLLTFPRFKDGEDWYVYVFVAQEFKGELCNSPEGELSWIDDAEVLSLPLWEGDAVFLPALYAGQFFCGVFTYVDKKLFSYRFTRYERNPGAILECLR